MTIGILGATSYIAKSIIPLLEKEDKLILLSDLINE